MALPQRLPTPTIPIAASATTHRGRLPFEDLDPALELYPYRLPTGSYRNEVFSVWRPRVLDAILQLGNTLKEDAVRGTMICEVTDTDEGRAALELSARLSARLGSRLVLVHVADGISSLADGSDEESVTMKASREGGVRLLARLAAEYGVADSAEQRSAVGDPAALIGQIAAEEAADVIVVGARPRGRFRRSIECRLANELESETPVPVLIAPLRSRVPKAVAKNGSRR